VEFSRPTQNLFIFRNFYIVRALLLFLSHALAIYRPILVILFLTFGGFLLLQLSLYVGLYLFYDLFALLYNCVDALSIKGELDLLLLNPHQGPLGQDGRGKDEATIDHPPLKRPRESLGVHPHETQVQNEDCQGVIQAFIRFFNHQGFC
jgi:hypothetical protein